MLLAYRKELVLPKVSTVHAASLMMLVTRLHRRLLETTTIANREIQPMISLVITSTAVIHSGMASSVKVSVAAMGNPLRGSVWSYQTQRLTILKCVFAMEGSLVMIPLYTCWNYTSNEI
jgi:hypothetical protein